MSNVNQLEKQKSNTGTFKYSYIRYVISDIYKVMGMNNLSQKKADHLNIKLCLIEHTAVALSSSCNCMIYNLQDDYKCVPSINIASHCTNDFKVT